jgi:hypothetical protein
VGASEDAFRTVRQVTAPSATTSQLAGKGPFVFPDAVTAFDLLDGASFLYFDEPLFLPLPPKVVGVDDPWRLLDLVQERQPSWAGRCWALSRPR